MQLGFVSERVFHFEVDPDRNLDIGVLTLFSILSILDNLQNPTGELTDSILITGLDFQLGFLIGLLTIEKQS